MNGQSDNIVVTPTWDAIRRYLENIRSQTYEELLNYPSPIAGCDVQFQQLSERRDKIIRELNRLEVSRRDSLTREDPVDMLDAFVRSSEFIDDAVARNFVAGSLGKR
jgi:vacuolar-type H+-ATPase subunit I/STV1